MEHVPVVVVGCGPTGASAAIMLGRRGIGTLVLERWPEVYPLPRAVHFDDEVFRVFASMGLQEQVRAISRPAPGMRLTDWRQNVLADFRRDTTGRVHGYPEANMFDQPDLEGVLREALTGYECVRFEGGVEVVEITQVHGDAGPVRVRYRDTATGTVHEVSADAVLGCDGANSTTRSAVGAQMEDLGFEQRWLVVDVESPEPLDLYDGVQQVCDNHRAATFMQVTPTRYRWEFQLRPDELPGDGDDAMVLELTRPWLADADPDRLTFLRRTTYTFRGVVADRWRNGRLFLLGDAAHQTPPFIGQGMCAGIRDAANLVWKLALVLTGRAEDRILDTYEAERRPYARHAVRLAISVGTLMTGGPAPATRARNAAIRTISRFLGAEDKLVAKQWPTFGPGPLVHDAGRRGKRTGDVFGQPHIGGTRLDDLTGEGWAIVHRGPDRTAAFDPETRAFFEELGAGVVRVSDTDTAALALLDHLRADAVLLRPDRIVAAAADTPDLRVWRRRLVAAGIALTR
ncbi:MULTISPECIES: bifunctional 3-(3-hydroxy-phenyl)propionate/3-hydroxycinnamic acid hydroxylase MhpA [Pseudonocardia]|uniref:3-(3-hydroxy-phenyl)propionate/3-hydroxycinnamic acid hydroxylase n=2 Tax=Pseudonocardia TaxID=1847 RepID=A0A1Y2MP86_PSEAH|nr:MULTISPECIES: bifunctional 3-(3-hydroxy-phenyl)propionate/3-hydroxycinnamic acid hydroxylase [Pseudonocardia]OSY36992.1 3-(3-hydroxy-phenyl)propionate/3-hydroxycinnamic acid hydroxylase [Pseudonocardia autotrophica]TDN75674.1 3-(3-hydroxy-phenyl)propionate hydroxylase [Pseudonocardia autotrophica]BBF99647.1 putative 3-(3-hydroxy-phenyl) propionate hydroxylase [Pseudonocardia autotrophica]GEC27709.1 putative 3-(3-hydroxy-phenyl) propionate hydroxylase [Pseudonocardia saturnea]